MMCCPYNALDGSMKRLNLDAVFDVALGYSDRRPGWTATLVYDPGSEAFVELRSSPPDLRGSSADEAEEVTRQYVFNAFQLTEEDIDAVRQSPASWLLVNRR